MSVLEFSPLNIGMVIEGIEIRKLESKESKQSQRTQSRYSEDGETKSRTAARCTFSDNRPPSNSPLYCSLGGNT